MTEPDDKPAKRRAERIGSVFRDVGRRGRDELTRPGGLGDNAHGAFRRWCQRVWRSRGGGMYAVGFMVAFLYFEFVDIVFDDVPKIFTTSWLSSEAIEFGIDFIVDTFTNIFRAFMWPVYVIQWQTPVGVFALAAMFYLFPRVVQKPIEHWMFEGEGAPDLAAEKADKKRRKAEAKAEKRASRSERKARR